MTPYETRSALSLVSGSLTLASAPHCFPQSQNVGPQGARAGDPLFLSSLYTDNCYHLATVEPATGRDCDRNPRTNEAGDHRAASDPPLGRGRFACNPLLVATLIHEYYALWPFDRLGAHAGRTAVAPPRVRRGPRSHGHGLLTPNIREGVRLRVAWLQGGRPLRCPNHRTWRRRQGRPTSGRTRRVWSARSTST